MPNANPESHGNPPALTLIPVVRQRGWQLLRTHFAISRGFALILVSAPDEWTLSRLRASICDLLPAGGRIRDVTFDSNFQPETFTLQILGSDLPKDTEGRLLEPAMTVWTEAPAPPLPMADPALHSWHAAFNYLNRQRNVLPRDLEGTVIIAGTPETLLVLRDSAPDLYSIRSAQIAFDRAPMEPGNEDHPALKRQRLTAYRRSLLAAFSAYQELALDNYAAADQACPDIWDIFVHPACSAEHLRPEDMDAAQRETPPRLPAQDLLPQLAQDDHRRTVLLADPGMGKSTLIQALIAHLASGRPLPGAPALTSLLPVPLILRDLVPLLPQHEVESWTWDSLITVLLEHYQREETAPLLCDAYKHHRDEFRQLLHSEPKLFFLIDGLDEIGDLKKRRKIVQCIQDGIKAVSNEARWLITSRVIGYEDAPVDVITKRSMFQMGIDGFSEDDHNTMRHTYEQALIELTALWGDFRLAGVHRQSSKAGFIPENTDVRPGIDLDHESSSGFKTNALARIGTVWANVTIAQRLHLSPFDDQRQDAFTSRWFRHRYSTDYSKELMREVRAHHHDGVRIISRVPNLLCMMNMLKRSGKPLPDGRAALYDEIVKAYLGGIDAAYKMQPILGHTCPFEPAERRFLLSLLGALMQKIRLGSENGDKDGNILIAMPELAQLLLPAIESMQQAGKVTWDHSATALLDELLHHIASRSGLLIPRSSDADGNTVYSFTHLSFLEFFAAEWLGKEFDRQRNRIVRRAEAAGEGQNLTEADLDREFPPAGPIHHPRDTFEHLPAQPAWHEPLIFLLESRKADAPTLLRWLFPALHATPTQLESWNLKPETSLLPFEAVRLAVQLAHDKELALSAETRRAWWRILWAAYLAWPHPPWEPDESKRWPIAPLLLEREDRNTEVLQALASIQPQHPKNVLYLHLCRNLTSADLHQLGALVSLTRLDLSNCTNLRDVIFLGRQSKLLFLNLSGCIGIQGKGCLSPLMGCPELESLYLYGCDGLSELEVLRHLPKLKMLDISYCPGLQEQTCLGPLAECKDLTQLYFRGCTFPIDLEVLRHLSKLKTLDLTGSTGLIKPDCLTPLAYCADLVYLNVSGCAGLSKADATAFCQKFTELHGPNKLLPNIIWP